jgi:hypothetical protein
LGNSVVYTVFLFVRASFEIIFEAYLLIAYTDRRRLKSRTLCFLIPLLLIYLACINNILEGPVDTFIFTSSMMILSVIIVNGDGILRKVFIIAAMIVPAMLTLIWLYVNLYFGGFVENFDLTELPDSEVIVEYTRDYSELLVCDFLLFEIMLRAKYHKISLILPGLIVVFLMLFETGLVIPVYSIADPHNPGMIPFICGGTVLTASVLNALVIYFISKSRKLREEEREKIRMKNLTDFDREYYDIVRGQIEETSMLRHDIVNYTEQIGKLVEEQDPRSRAGALKMINELQRRLSYES